MLDLLYLFEKPEISIEAIDRYLDSINIHFMALVPKCFHKNHKCSLIQSLFEESESTVTQTISDSQSAVANTVEYLVLDPNNIVAVLDLLDLAPNFDQYIHNPKI